MLKSMLATGFALITVAPALAQEPCSEQVHALWANVQEEPQLDDAAKSQVADALNGALGHAQNGDEQTCLQVLQQVKTTLNVQD